MGKFLINGGHRLQGRVRVTGAKNSILPILAAAILTSKTVRIHDCPRLLDVENMLEILRILGCQVTWLDDVITIDPSNIRSWELPEYLTKELRSSIVMLGPILGRCRRAKLTYPGGCEIGLRPIDLHLKGLKQLNAKIDESHGYIVCEGADMIGTEILLDYPSVGATENIMLAAVNAKGQTIIRNAAKEPEIIDLQNFINAMGGKVWGAGSNSIIIQGTSDLHEVDYRVIPDRIVAGTYMVAAAITGGDLWIENVIIEHLYPIISKLREAGCEIQANGQELHIIGPKRPSSVHLLETLPHPGFPTDMQAQMLALLTVADGTSVIIENIFENRYKHVAELIRMGAQVTIKDRMAVIKGVESLTGAAVEAKDLRGGAALVLAGLRAKGTTEVSNIYLIDRGYEELDKQLCALGAEIQRI